MKNQVLLLLTAFCIVSTQLAKAQCTATLTHTGTSCPGSTLKMTSTSGLRQFSWYLGAVPLDTIKAPYYGTTVAGQKSGTSGTDSTHLSMPNGVFVDASGNVYVSENNNNRVTKWAVGATFGVTVAGHKDGTSGSDSTALNNPRGVYVDASGNVYVADGNNNRVQKWASGASFGTTVAGHKNGTSGTDSTSLSHPYGVFVNAAGTVYVGDNSNHRVQKWLANAKFGTTVAGHKNCTPGTDSTSLYYVAGVYVDAASNVYVADYNNSRIQKWASGAKFGTTVAGHKNTTSGSDSTSLNTPNGIYVDASGNKYISDQSNHRIQRWASGASYGTTVAGITNSSGTDSTRFTFPSGVWLDSKSNIYVADAYNNRVQKWAQLLFSSSIVASTKGSYTLKGSNYACSVTSAAVQIQANDSSLTTASFCSNKTYVFNMITYSAPGTYIVHKLNKAGCDSACILILTSKPISTTGINATICSNNSYTFNGKTYTTTGTYKATLTNAIGCDSIVTLNLTVKKTSTSSFTASSCANVPYIFNGASFSFTGNYTVTLPGANSLGCDSVITFHFTAIKTGATSITSTVCSDKPYNFNGVSINTTGTYADTFTNKAGCDSIVTLHLTVKQASSNTVNASFCSDKTFIYSGKTYSTAGTYTVLLMNKVACDSIVTLNLTSKPISTTSINATICSNKNYAFNGKTYTVAGTYKATLTNSIGCDSIVTLNLTVNKTSTGSVTASSCSNVPYNYNGKSYSTTGNYAITLPGANLLGCDSVVTLHFTAIKTSSTSITSSVCSNKPYNFNGVSINTTGTYIDTFTNKAGCDSFVTLHLTVKNTSTSTFNASFCSNKTYVFNGKVYSTGGTYIVHLNNKVGCDSAITFNLTAISISTTTINATTCSNKPYAFNGKNYSITGSYTAKLTNAAGCDSIITLNLTVNKTNAATVTTTICANKPYIIGSSSFSTAGNYTATTTNKAGCDSVVTLHLSVKKISTSTVNATICSNKTYTFNGSTYNTAGSYTATLTNKIGCDSIITLNLTVKNISTTTINATICSNKSYAFNGSTYTTAGSYKATLTNKIGCDSIITLNLTVNNTSTSNTNATICSNKSYSFGGSTYTVAGTYTAKLTNAAGCDSVVTLNLTVNSTSSSTVNATICSNTSYGFNGSTYTTAGTYTATLTNAAGCDSVVTLQLAVNNTTGSSINATICSNKSYNFNGATLTGAGTYIDTFTNSVGCDSFVTLHLTVNSISSSTVNATICSNKSYSFNGSTYTTAGTYTATLTNSLGCDSVITLSLTVNNTSSSIVNATFCSNKSYSFNGSTYSAAGTYTATLTNSVGCDSVVTLNLTKLNTSSSSVNATFCSNKSYSFNGSTYSTAGTYTATLTNSVGCDSVVTLNLTALSTSSKTVIGITCANTPYSFNGLTFNVSGTYATTLTNSVGCDSVVTLNLTVLDTSASTLNASRCADKFYSFNGTTYLAAGSYIVKLTNSVGCDSVIHLNLTVKNISTTSVSATICSNKSYTFNGKTYNMAGVYSDTFTNSIGCDSIVTLNLTVNDTSTGRIYATICSNRFYLYNGSTYNVAGAYQIKLTNKAGCDSIVTLNLTVLNTSSSTLHVTITHGNSFIFNGSLYKSSGVYSALLTNAAGCDSSVVLYLTVNPATIITVNLTAGTGSSIAAKWNHGTGPYKFYYATMQTINSFTSIITPDTTYTIKATKPGTTYIVYVVDTGSTEIPKPQSSYAYYSTSGGTCNGSVPSLSATTSITTATLSWTGTGSDFQVFYKNAGGNSWKSSSDTTAKTQTLTALTPNTCYVAYVANRCGKTYGFSSAIDTFCTLPSCAAPVSVTLSSASCHGFTASWPAVSGISMYTVVITRTSGSGAPTSFSYRSSTNSFTLNSGSKGTTYSVYIKSFCNPTTLSLTNSSSASITTLSLGCKDDGAPNDFGNTVVTANAKLNVYPNPNNGQFTVDLTTANLTDAATINVYNMLGQMMDTRVVNNNNGSIHTMLDNNNLASGIYIVKVVLGDKSYASTINIQK